ncbi:hypothetical protein THAOC_12221 [Thalassiosira oceanica]|uniref:Uncharacterized protein n=1 Tax=Thalassiosira oceanica TaxID=159749 RepID=K0SN77_THAOC|nr:hypothetical protein THAOC_12221 [Thalassiosira oceanica]|eukprot:EJK66820.1 hypothetical protein THAOC_12221 [Thalassiosira oceanica]
MHRPVNESRPDLRHRPRQRPPRGRPTMGRRRGRYLASPETISGRHHGCWVSSEIAYSPCVKMKAKSKNTGSIYMVKKRERPRGASGGKQRREGRSRATVGDDGNP